jgi:hypothetical protein
VNLEVAAIISVYHKQLEPLYIEKERLIQGRAHGPRIGLDGF